MPIRPAHYFALLLIVFYFFALVVDHISNYHQVMTFQLSLNLIKYDQCRVYLNYFVLVIHIIFALDYYYLYRHENSILVNIESDKNYTESRILKLTFIFFAVVLGVFFLFFQALMFFMMLQ